MTFDSNVSKLSADSVLRDEIYAMADILPATALFVAHRAGHIAQNTGSQAWGMNCSRAADECQLLASL